MSTLLEIENAAEALPTEQQAELIRFLTARLQPTEISCRARLVAGPDGTLLLEAHPDAPPMTTENIKRMLEDFP